MGHGALGEQSERGDEYQVGLFRPAQEDCSVTVSDRMTSFCILLDKYFRFLSTSKASNLYFTKIAKQINKASFRLIILDATQKCTWKIYWVFFPYCVAKKYRIKYIY